MSAIHFLQSLPQILIDDCQLHKAEIHNLNIQTDYFPYSKI